MNILTKAAFPRLNWREKRLLTPQMDAEELFSFIADDHYKKWVDYTTPKRQIWRWCDAFKSGLQWSVFDHTMTRLIVPKLPEGRVRMTVNKIRPWAFDMEAKLVALDPVAEVVPRNMNSENKSAALVGEKFRQHYDDVLEFLEAKRELVRNVLTFGESYYWVGWDEFAGPVYYRDKLEKQIDPADGQERLLPIEGQQEIIREGEIVGNVLTPFAVFDDCQPGRLDDKFFLGVATWETLDFIYNKWKVDVNPEMSSETERTDVHNEMVRNLVSGVGTYFPRGGMSFVEGASVYHWYQRPQEGLEDGFFAIVSNGKLLDSGEWPAWMAKMGGYPIVDYYWERHTGRRYSHSPIEDQIPIQKEVNKTRSQIIEAKNKMTAIKWFIPLGSGIKDLNDMSGESVKYVPGRIPTQNEPKPIPHYIFRLSEYQQSDLEDVQHRHSASKAIVPPGVKSGTGLALLQEMDDRPITLVEKNLNGSIARTFTKVLQIASAMITTPRAISYVGRGNARAVEVFVGTDLRDHTKVKIRTIPGISRSPTAAKEEIMEMFRIGMFRKPDGTFDTEGAFELLQYAIPGSIYERDNQHRAMQREENDTMWRLLDQPPDRVMIPAPQPWHKHSIHIAELEDEMNTREWVLAVQEETLKFQGNPGPMYQAFYGHWTMHHQFLSAALMSGTAIQGKPQGGQATG